MLLKKTNIEYKLAAVKIEHLDTEAILQEVYSILQDSQIHKRIHNNLNNNKAKVTNSFDFDLLDTSRIYHLNQIQHICITYRLRFLSTKYFKGDIPQEALDKIAILEKQHEIEVKGFKIIAPSKLFKLKEKDDPLLFAPIGNDYFYLIHKWGTDLHPLRKILMWPFRNIVNLALLTFAVSYMTSLLVPNGLFSATMSNAQFFIIFFFIFKSIAAILIFYGISMGKNFNTAIWNSKYNK